MHWREIENEKEKYAAYLCSREWAEKREKVRKRAYGKCERCFARPMECVHHLTYLRKYHEDLNDLEALCKGCHEFIHGKSDQDPRSIAVRPPLVPMETGSYMECPVCDCVKVFWGTPHERPVGEFNTLRIPCRCENGHDFMFFIGRTDGPLILFLGNFGKSNQEC